MLFEIIFQFKHWVYSAAQQIFVIGYYSHSCGFDHRALTLSSITLQYQASNSFEIFKRNNRLKTLNQHILKMIHILLLIKIIAAFMRMLSLFSFASCFEVQVQKVATDLSNCGIIWYVEIVLTFFLTDNAKVMYYQLLFLSL